LYYKIPLIQNVQFLDKRVIDIDAPSEEVIALDQKRIIVDAYAKFIIRDPLKFYISVGNERVAQSRLASIINAKIRGVLGKENLVNLISTNRNKLMSQITKDVAEEAKDFGIDVIDVRIKRADLPSANSEAIFRRMQTERTREAKEFRAEGFEVGQTIKSKADKEVAIILAEARKTAQITRGEGDGLRNKIFADAFGRDPEFFSFYRAMQSYEKSLISGSETSLVLSPDSEFFRYFGESGLKKVLKK
jgi:membrane protease subunit HflC